MRKTSSNVRTARNALQTSLVILGKIPIPGIDAVTEALKQALTKVQEMRDNAAGWIDLSERVQSLAFLVSTDHDITPAFGKRLVKVLQDITEDINASGKSGYLKRFLNSTGDASFLTNHNSTLNDLVTDITVSPRFYPSIYAPIHIKFEVCIKTNRTTSQLRQDLGTFKSNLVVQPVERTRKLGFFQIFTAPIKAAHGTVGLKAKSGTSMPDAQQHFAGRIEVNDGVVGIHIE
ncbi:hypothetical protein MSAN_00841900 [Mycena sanguinolenta]|uniref:Uncharacterized protein n=1 Tax=Mycena sanguinolenta TaxID=230812 RepID=A0A8H6YWL6_9AGAR|nr:hypothetical protein MSAN_00841900 [Mycena sanguinolenta]